MASGEPKELPCLCNWGGRRRIINDKTVVYDGGEVALLFVSADTRFEDFVHQACVVLGIEESRKKFYFVMKYDPTRLIKLSNQQSLEAMVRVNDKVAEVFIMGEEDAVEEEANGLRQASTGGSNVVERTEPLVIPGSGPSTMPNNLVMVRSSSSSQCHFDSTIPQCSSDFDMNDGNMVEQSAIYEGKLFSSPEEFKMCVAAFALLNKFAFTYLDNKPSYYRLRCKATECEWMLTARCDAGQSMVRVIRFRNVHKHTAQDVAAYKPIVRAKCIAPLLKRKLLASPMYPTREICRDFQREYDTSLQYMQAWRAKEQALYTIRGDPCDSFKFVPWMCQRLRDAIPGTCAEYTLTPEGRFQHMFIAYGPMIEGFQVACRPLLFIDACHLKAYYGGVVMAATAVDGNNGLYPLAYAFASAENDENWLWFMQQLLVILHGRQVVLMTDRNPSLLNAIFQVFGRECNSWCLRHLKENFSSFCRTKGVNNRRRETALKTLTDIAYARDVTTYEHHLRTMEKIGIELKQWVEDNRPMHWANAFFPMQRWDWLSTNPAESFNAWIGELRYLTIYEFMKAHANKVTKFFWDKKHEFDRWSSRVGPRIENLIKANQEKGAGFIASAARDGHFNVITRTNKQFSVDIIKCTCSCLEWQMTGIPCPHMVSVVCVAGLDVYDYVEKWFHNDLYTLMLGHMLPALPTHDAPTVEDLSMMASSFEHNLNQTQQQLPKPPLCKRPAGRPKKKRIESQYQDKRVSRCSRCHAVGHNRRNCTSPIPE